MACDDVSDASPDVDAVVVVGSHAGDLHDDDGHCIVS